MTIHGPAGTSSIGHGRNSIGIAPYYIGVIVVTSVIPAKEKQTRADILELLPSEKPFEGVTSQLATRERLPSTDPIHKVTIIPRGRALGLTQQLPTEDKHTLSKDYILNKIAIFLGGRAAEELVLNTQTTGGGNDLEMATEWPRKMVCDFGMSEKMGPLTFGKREEHIFLGREIAQHKDYSEKTAVDIDTEIKGIVLQNYDRARTLIQQHLDKLHRLATALLEKEVLAGAEIDEVFGLKAPAPEAPAKILAQEGRLL